MVAVVADVAEEHLLVVVRVLAFLADLLRVVVADVVLLDLDEPVLGVLHEKQVLPLGGLHPRPSLALLRVLWRPLSGLHAWEKAANLNF